MPEAPLGQDAPGPAAVDADMDVAGEPCTNGFATENGGCAPGPESNRFSPDSIGSALTSERQHDDFDMNAIYQTRKRSSSGVLSPVYHSDAKVPLRKLFENLEVMSPSCMVNQRLTFHVCDSPCFQVSSAPCFSPLVKALVLRLE